jgi:hypothetical protein
MIIPRFKELADAKATVAQLEQAIVDDVASLHLNYG